jgi:hypothetical protein
MLIRHNLTLRKIELTGNLKIIMDTRIIKTSGAAAMGAEFIIIPLSLNDGANKFSVLTYQMNNSDAGKAFTLGTSITALINYKIQQK